MSFTVTTDTSSLVGNPAGPFSLDFQFIDGSGAGDGNNTVTLSDFSVGGGSWAGPASLSLSDTSFFTESIQPFTPGSSLSFRVSLTTLMDAGGTPDQFSFAILDGGLIEIPTQGLGDALLTAEIDSPNPLVQTFGTDPSRTALSLAAPSVGVPAVPDSGAPLAAVAGLWTLAIAAHRWNRQRGSRDLGQQASLG